ncbi:MAG TPA: hypothetical protein VIO81_04920, partial [Methyloversatilis sp.]
DFTRGVADFNGVTDFAEEVLFVGATHGRDTGVPKGTVFVGASLARDAGVDRRQARDWRGGRERGSLLQAAEINRCQVAFRASVP